MPINTDSYLRRPVGSSAVFLQHNSSHYRAVLKHREMPISSKFSPKYMKLFTWIPAIRNQIWPFQPPYLSLSNIIFIHWIICLASGSVTLPKRVPLMVRSSASSSGRFTHSMPFPCRDHAVPLPCRAAKGFGMCLSHLIYTVRPCLIHTCHAMASANQTRPHCVN